MNPFQLIQNKIKTGMRLSFEDGLGLFKSKDILAIGRMAHEVRDRMHGRRAFYAVNQMLQLVLHLLHMDYQILEH